MAQLKRTFVSLLFFLAAFYSKSQIGGTFSVPNDFPTIAAAVQTLNVMGVAGGATIDVSAGHTETVAAGGIKLFQVAGASPTSQVVFRKSGTGANPLITAYTGTAGPTSTMQDGVWWLIGADYITIDGIDIADPNTSGSDMMEFGYGLFKASTQNGCQNNTIKNCVITLNRSNVAGSPNLSPGGSRAINLASCNYTNQTVSTTHSLVAGASGNNAFYGNLMQNCHVGITLIGAAVTGSLADSFNDVGGLTAATGNTIINFGGGQAVSPSFGVYTISQGTLNISNNLFNNNTGTGGDPYYSLFTIYNGGTNFGTSLTIRQNTMSLTNLSNSAVQMTYIQDHTQTSNNTSIRVCKNVFPVFTSTVGLYINLVYVEGGISGSIYVDSNAVGNVNIGPVNAELFYTRYGQTASMSSNTVNAVNGTSGLLTIFESEDPNNLYVTNNLVSNVSFSASAGNTIICVNTGGANSHYILGNTFQNFAGGGNSGSWMKGIIANSSISTRQIMDNVLRNWTTFSGSTGGFNFRGIEILSGQFISVYRNKITDINSTATNQNSYNTFDGIYMSGPSSAEVRDNKVAGLSFNHRGSLALVRQITTGSITYANNLLGDVDIPNADNNDALVGFYLQTGTTQLINNSVYLNSTATNSLYFGSAVVNIPTSQTITARNNIFVNVSGTGTVGIAKVFRWNSTSMTTYGLNSNNNALYIGSPGPSRVIAEHPFNGTFSTVPLFQATVSPRDNNSFEELPPFLSTTGGAANFLDIDPTIETRVEGTAIPLNSYSLDYSGAPRHPTQPDIGAWEGDYLQADFFPPTVYQSGFTGGACNTTGRTLTVSITDPSGVATGSLSPRLYFRKNFTLYSSTQGSLTAGTPTNGVWTFSMTYSASSGDQISYFLAVQDNAPLHNVMVFPANSYTATDVNNVSVPPNPAQTYSISSTALSGTYNVGSGQTYTTLSQAANAYNTSCLAGPVTFSLTDASYSTNETFPVTFQLNSDASASNSLLIIPAASVSGSIIGTTSAPAVIKFLDSRYITLNGNNQSGSLYVQNANTSTSTAIWLASGSGPLQGNNNISINALTVRGGTHTISGNFGILSSANTTAIGIPTGAINNDFISIQNNNFSKVGTAIHSTGSTSLQAGGPNNWAVSGNTVGTATSGFNNYGGCGIFLKSISQVTVSGNLFQNGSPTERDMAAVMLAENVDAVKISLNTINGYTSSATCCSWPLSAGIYLGGNVKNTDVERNVISQIATSSSDDGISGIFCSTREGSGNRINNNMIQGIVGRSDSDPMNWPVGIFLAGSTGSISVDFNTVYLNTSTFAYATSSVLGTAALLVNTTGSNIGVRNNILANVFEYTNHANDKAYSFYNLSPASSYTVINYNNYYVGGTNNLPVLAYSGGEIQSLSALVTAVGGNANSNTLAPVFTSSVDLHLQSVSGNAHLDNTATPVSGITVDIDGQTRSSISPDIGADEFSSATCTGVATGTIASANYSVCSGQTIAVIAATSGTDSGISYQWQVSPTSGGTFTNVSAPGSLTLSLQPAVAGTLYYRMKSTCSVNSATAVTNEATLTTYATPATTVAASSASLCAGGSFTLNANASLSSTFSWTGPLSFNSSAQNPVVSNAVTGASGQYTLVATSGPCSSTPLSVSVSVSANPTIAVTGNTTICAGSTTTLNAAGASTYSWSTGATLSSTTVNPVNNTSYTVTGSFTNGCASSRTVAVQTNSIPVITVSAGAPSVCAGSAASFTASGASTYTWNTNATGSVLTITPSAATVYTVTGATGLGCRSSATIATGVYTLPVLSISSSTSTACAGSTVGLSGSGAVNYTWNPGNLPAVSVTVTPLTTTVYTLTGVNTEGCVSRLTTTVTTLARPTISAPDGTVCSGTSFVLQPTGAASYTFSSGSSTVNPVNTTTYSIYGISSAGCMSTNTAVVNVSVAPLPTISVNSGTLCSGRIFTIVASGASTYTYSSGSPFVSPSADANYSVTGTSIFGCVSTNTAVVSVSVFASPTIAASGGSICSGNSFVFNPAGANSYSFSGGSATVTPVNTSTYSIVGVDNMGCISINTIVATVTVFASPTVAVSNGTVCSGSSFTLQPSGAASYTFSSGSAIVTPANTTTYSVYGTSSAGCVSTNTAIVNVSVAPLPTIAVNSGTLCSGRVFTLTPSGAASYVYSSGSPFVSPVTNTTYFVSGTSAFGCASTNTATANITVYASPTVAVSGGSICSGQSFVFNPTGALNYTISGGSATVTPVNTSIYSVTGIDAIGCISINTAVATVTVFATPTIAVSGGSVCEGSSFALQPSGASSYTISGGTFTVTPPVNTTYVIAGTSTAGCISASVAAGVSVVTIPTITVNDGTICAGQSFTITPSGAATYSYSGGTSVVSPNASASYTVIGLNTLGCTSANTATAHVTVNPLPVVSITGPLSLCAGSVGTLTATGASNYSWTQGGQSPSQTITPLVNTVYTVTGADNNGCTNTALRTVSVEALPAMTITGNTSICQGLSTNLFVSGTAISYTWSTGATGNLLSASPVTSTVYNVYGSGLNSCIGTASVLVFVNSIPNLQANASSTSICIGDQVTLSGSGASSYTWSGGISDNVPFAPTQSNTYTLSAIALNGCKGHTTVLVVVNPLPVISINGPLDSVCIGSSVELTASGANIYTWQHGGGSPSTLITPDSTKVYKVTGTDINGCVSSKSFTVYVSGCVGIGENFLGGFQVYPNPTSGIINVSFSQKTEGAAYFITNYLSQKVTDGKFDSEKVCIDLGENAKGLYFVHLTVGGRIKTVVKVVVE